MQSNFVGKLILLLILFLPFNVYSSKLDYIYPNRGPSFSNFGTVGLISMPTARFYQEGTVGFSWTKMDPYLRGSIVAYPFNWMEASYQYVDINNQLYSEIFAFSGNQTFKDRALILNSCFQRKKNFPALALGLRDAAGTGLFASEYLVMSKNIGIADFSLVWAGESLQMEINIKSIYQH